MNRLEHRIPPPILLLLAGAAMWLAAQNGPTLPIDDPLRLGVAIGVALLGVAVLVSGFRAFRAAKTTIDPVRIDAASALVTSGIFTRTRNPMYVGFTALLIGWLVYLAAPWAAFGPVFFALFIDRFQIIPEERVLATKFGAAYRDYQGRVRRWL